MGCVRPATQAAKTVLSGCAAACFRAHRARRAPIHTAVGTAMQLPHRSRSGTGTPCHCAASSVEPGRIRCARSQSRVAAARSSRAGDLRLRDPALARLEADSCRAWTPVSVLSSSRRRGPSHQAQDRFDSAWTVRSSGCRCNPASPRRIGSPRKGGLSREERCNSLSLFDKGDSLNPSWTSRRCAARSSHSPIVSR